MNINLYTWYGKRELDYCPKHFIKCNAGLTDEAKQWVYEKLSGRFYVTYAGGPDWSFLFVNVIYFEDPQEAMLYELTWS